jgi:hypothetical protein
VAKRNISAYRETNPGRPYEWAHLLYVFIRKELLKSCRMSSKLITLDDAMKRNVLVFTDNNFSCGIRGYVSNDRAYDRLSGTKY